MASDREPWKFGAVFCSILGSFLLVPLCSSRIGVLSLNAFLIFILFYTLRLSRATRNGLLLGAGLLLWRLALTVWLSCTGPSDSAGQLHLLVAATVSNTYVAAMLLAYVLRRRGGHGGIILAALTSYIMLGFILTDVFLFIEKTQPGSFWVQVPGSTGFTWADSASYSFHLLSPMGPPGVVAVGLGARMVAIVGAFLGVCYMAILVSKIVNWAPLLKPKE